MTLYAVRPTMAIAQAELALGGFLRDAGCTDEAQNALQRALSVMQHVRRSLRHEALRNAFEKNPILSTFTPPYGSTPPTVVLPVPLQPCSPYRMNFWMCFPVSTSAV
jgi:hypothetical protein